MPRAESVAGSKRRAVAQARAGFPRREAAPRGGRELRSGQVCERRAAWLCPASELPVAGQLGMCDAARFLVPRWRDRTFHDASGRLATTGSGGGGRYSLGARNSSERTRYSVAISLSFVRPDASFIA